MNSTSRRSLIATPAIVLALVAGALTAPGASAATGDAGWVRLAHLSPDTKSVDVRVSALSGGSTQFELEGVEYGAVSPYRQLPEGSYAISMVPAGAPDDTTPVLEATVDIDGGGASTVTAYGPNDDLQVRAFEDDLSMPSEGKARIRLIQASTTTESVDVTTSTGIPIAQNAMAGSVTGYAEVDPGAWTLELMSANASDLADIDVATGSVSTLFVLDNASGGLTILPVLDSAATGDVPVGGVRTGGGGMATELGTPPLERLVHAVDDLLEALIR